MGTAILIIGIVSLLLSLVKFFSGIRVHYRAQAVDCALQRQRLLHELNELIEAESEMQFVFHPIVLAQFEESCESDEMKSIRDKAENYNKQVGATLEMREMIIDGGGMTPYALKIIATHVAGGKSFCNLFARQMPSWIKLSELASEFSHNQNEETATDDE